MKKKKRNLLAWLRFKAWFVIDLPYFIRFQNYTVGAELGAKGGRSMYYMLSANQHLNLTGIDKWQVIEGSAYKRNDLNEKKCRKRLKKFSKRIKLIKGDAFQIADQVEDQSLDFIHYDLQSRPMKDKHEEMIGKWLNKLKQGGILIGRDFRDFRPALYNLGISENDIKPCRIGGRVSERLEYVIKKV